MSTIYSKTKMNKMGRTIRLTESDIRMMVEQAVRIAINESRRRALYEGRGYTPMLTEGQLRDIVSRVISGIKQFMAKRTPEEIENNLIGAFIREEGLTQEDIENMGEDEFNRRFNEWQEYNRKAWQQYQSDLEDMRFKY